MSRAVCAIAVLICSGCAVTVQNRYSVLGFDQWEMLSSERARTFSLLVLSGVAIVSAACGAGGFWFVQRWIKRRNGKTTLTHEISVDRVSQADSPATYAA